MNDELQFEVASREAFKDNGTTVSVIDRKSVV